MATVFTENWNGFSGVAGGAGTVQGDSRFTFTGTPSAFTFVTGRGGSGNALRQPASNATTLSATFTSAVSAFTFGCYAGFPGGSIDSSPEFSFFSNTTRMVGFIFNTNGSVSVDRAGTVLATSATGIIPVSEVGIWHKFELEVVISDTVGRMTLYIDDVQVINATSVDTRNGAPTTVDRMQWNPTATSVTLWDADDVYVIDVATRPVTTAARRRQVMTGSF